MKMTNKLCFQAGFGFIAGSAVGYLFGTQLPQLPVKAAVEIIQILASISAIAGSMVSWSSNWIAQSRSIIRDIDYTAADDLFHQLGDFQKELIWRWGILFFSSILAITLAVLAKTPILSKIWLLTFSSGFLGIVVVFVFFLFRGMTAVVGLKNKLDDYERNEVRKKRLLGKNEKEETMD